MAGDLPFEEILVIHGPQATVPSVPDGTRVLQRYGDRVEIWLGSTDGGGSRIPDVSDAVLDTLTDTERMGVEAFLLRSSAEHIAAKQARPRDGEPWDMAGCTGPRGASADTVEGAWGTTSKELTGSVAVGIVIVDGPPGSTRFTDDEQRTIKAEVQAGLIWLASVNKTAEVTFYPVFQRVTIGVRPTDPAPDAESRWRNPAMAQLGFPATWAGVDTYVRSLRDTGHTRWAYCAFFVKGYPLKRFAYACIGGPRVVMDYANDGWGPANIDRVFAHETGHIFQCADEYTDATYACDCGGSFGVEDEPNANCDTCAEGGGVACLMRGNDWTMCASTQRQLGWASPSLRSTQPGVANVVALSPDRLDLFVADTRGRAWTTEWEPSRGQWQGRFGYLRDGRTAPGGPVTAVSRLPDVLDAFMVSSDGIVATCAWAPVTGWGAWARIGDAVFPGGATITAVSRSEDTLDLFATDGAGRVLTGAWRPGVANGWRGWQELAGGRAKPGSSVAAVSRRPGTLDVFVTGSDGGVYTTGREAGAPDQWRAWRRIRDLALPLGAPIGAVSRRRDRLDIFVTDTAGRVMGTGWEPAFGASWQPWESIQGGGSQPGAPVTAVSHRENVIDIFVMANDGIVCTDLWDPATGWQGWRGVSAGKAIVGTTITAVSRGVDLLDVFIIGLDGRIYHTWWNPNPFNTWSRWYPMGN